MSRSGQSVESNEEQSIAEIIERNSMTVAVIICVLGATCIKG